MLIPDEAPGILDAIINTTKRHNLPLSLLSFGPTEVSIMSRPNPTAEQGRAFLVALLGKTATIEDSFSLGREDEEPWRTLTADFADILSPIAGFDHYQIVIWVQIDEEGRS